MSKESRIAYFKKQMNEVPEDEPNREAIIKAFKEHIKSIEKEDEEDE